MDTEKSKPILIGVAVVCLAGAGVLLYINMGGGSGGGSGKPIPMICIAFGQPMSYRLSLGASNTVTMGAFKCSQLIFLFHPLCVPDIQVFFPNWVYWRPV